MLISQTITICKIQTNRHVNKPVVMIRSFSGLLKDLMLNSTCWDQSMEAIMQVITVSDNRHYSILLKQIILIKRVQTLVKLQQNLTFENLVMKFKKICWLCLLKPFWKNLLILF